MNKSLKINETRKEVYSRDDYTCQHPDCDVMGWDNLQLAHSIRQGQEVFIQAFWLQEFDECISKKRATEILNSPENLTTACSKHNSYFDCTFRPEDVKRILRRIHENKNT